MVTFGERIRVLCERLKKSETDMATDLGLSKSRFSHYVTGKRKVPSELLQQIIDTYHINPRFLFKEGAPLYLENESKEKNSYPTIKLYGAIAAGQPLEATEDIGKIICPWTDDDIEGLFALKVNGDSMNKVVQDGYYAVFKQQKKVKTGEIAAVLVNGGEATLKKVHILSNKIILEPLSYNQDHEEQVYGEFDDIRVIGKYIGCVSPYED